MMRSTFAIALTSKVLNRNDHNALSNPRQKTKQRINVTWGFKLLENPFEMLANQIHMAINTPHERRLARWIYGVCNLYDPLLTLPRGKYLVCGYGRMAAKPFTGAVTRWH